MNLEDGINGQGNQDYNKRVKAARQDAAYVDMDILAGSKYEIPLSEPPQATEKPQEHPEEMLAPPLPPAREPIAHKNISNEKQPQVHTEEIDTEDARRRKIAIFSATAIILIIALMGIILTNPSDLTGYTTATREIQQTTNISQVFSQNTEIQLELNNIISFKISGKLEGTEAKVKLRINGTEYLVADIINPATQNQTTPEQTPQYTITTDKTSYTLGETATITITPDIENKSFYISYGEQTQKLDNNTYTPQEPGEYQAIALITLTDDILRLETNFTLSNESINETTPPETPNPTPEPTPQETASYEFSELCTETCTLPENSNPILIIETEENTTLTITQITTTQQRENNAPVQIQVIPDINLITGQTTTLDLNEYFTDTDKDTIQYDINQIPEINATINQKILTITSAIPGTYTAYIYATDGDKLVTSNTFTITITGTTPEQTTTETNQTTNTTTNETTPITNITAEPPIITDPCANPDLNLRPSACFVGLEEQAFTGMALPLQDKQRGTVGVFTRFGNLIIRGLLTQDATGNPKDNDFQIGFTETNAFSETNTMTAWIDSETGNLYLKGKIYENQEILNPSQYNTLVMRNKFGLILGYFDQLKGDLYLRGNIVQLGKI